MTERNPIDRRLGELIRKRRASLRITQAALGDQIGVTFQQVQKYERGFNRIAASRLVDIARVLQTTAGELLDSGAADSGPGAQALVHWYNQIEDELHREALVNLAKALVPSRSSQPS